MNKWLSAVRMKVSGSDRFISRVRRRVSCMFAQLATVHGRLRFAGVFFAVLLLPFSQAVQSAPCAASGNTLSGAKANYTQQCSSQRRQDCDYIENVWYCSSEQIGDNVPSGLAGSESTNNSQASSNGNGSGNGTDSDTSESSGVCLDPDGDGYGWNGASCRVAVTTPSAQNNAGTQNSSGAQANAGSHSNSGNEGSTSGSAGSNADGAECLDPDGDGWGWNGASCRVVSSSVAQAGEGSQSNNNNSASNSGASSGSGPCLDPDGDGWGWNGASCRATSTSSSTGSGSSSSSASNASNASNGAITASDITDLILLTGQSNALGANTAYDASLDSPDRQVFAFTNNGWRRANLNQIWDRGWHPRNNPDTDPANNLLLHFGKRVVLRDSKRVVGFVLVSAPGAPIANWDYRGEFYNTVRSRVLDAINQLPHKSQLDGILWHQGETDARDTPLYGAKLYALIRNLRSESWFANGRPFICGEIAKRGGVNNQLNRLNTDNDSSTACVSAAGVETKVDNSHFTAVGLREIGRRYGDRYYQMTR